MMVLNRMNFKLCILFLSLIVVSNIFLLIAIFNQEKKNINTNSKVKQNDEKSKLRSETNLVPLKKNINTTDFYYSKIKKEFENLNVFYKNPFLSPLMKKHLDTLVDDLKVRVGASERLLAQAVSWITWQELLPRHGESLLGSVLNSLKTLPIKSVDNAVKGTQLKLMVSLPSNFKALFKPKWYSPDAIIEGAVYAGKDRHFGEVTAFHLSLLLGLPQAPLAVMRSLHVQNEIMPVAASQLLETFSINKENETCFYGVCHYCHPNDTVCSGNGILEGALIFWLPEYMAIKKYRHPWTRTYRKNIPARWEVDRDFCKKLTASKFYKERKSLILDLTDVAIFDFLIDNGDRHHFEMFSKTESMVLLIDNGKSFGNPYIDHIDILAPLYQCCRVKHSTYERLLLLKGGTLTNYLSKMLKSSHNTTVLQEAHFKALDRRLMLIFSTLLVCFKEKGKEAVIVR